MKKRKLKGFVLPTLYFLITISIFVGVVLIGRNVVFEPSDYDYGIGALQNNSESVVNEDTTIDNTIKKPVDENYASIGVHYYESGADKASQQNSLIYYENTYMPNTGVLYQSDSEFSVSSVFQGRVTEIIDDEFFGKCVVVEHTSNLRTYYYGLSEINVSVGDELISGTEIGMSNNNAIYNTKKTFLLEVYYNNELINPEKFIGSKITDYN